MKIAIALAIILAFTAIASARNAVDVQPLLIGAKIPEVQVQDLSGKKFSLPSLIKGQPTIVVFFRGGWCPYCNRHLLALGESAAELEELGFQIIALSPDAPDTLAEAAGSEMKPYLLLSDSSMAAAKAFGIDFEVDAETLLKYKDYGISLEEASDGANKKSLPVPAIFIISGTGEISFTHVDPDYRFRISSELLLAAARHTQSFREQ